MGTIVGTCTGSAGTDATCDAVVAAHGGKEATCVGTVDGTSGGACAWTSVGACAWTPANACTWNNNANAACTECDAGQYNSVVELYNAETGVTTQEGGAGPCIDCMAGEYQAETVQTSCIKCVAGKIAATAKMSACTECLAGQYFAEEGGAGPCNDCTAGQYQHEAAKNACISCASGFRNDGGSGCAGANEICGLGDAPCNTATDLASCQALCAADATCVSFEFKASSAECQLSTSCVKSDLFNEWVLYIKVASQCMHCSTYPNYHTSAGATASTSCTSCPKGRFADKMTQTCGKCNAGNKN